MKKITKVKTLRQYVTAHRRLWDWLAKNPMKGKEDWPGWKYNGGTYEYVICYCFMCELAYAYRRHFKLVSSRCAYCLLDWGVARCEEKGSAYSDYVLSGVKLMRLYTSLNISGDDNLSRLTPEQLQEWELAVRDVQLLAMRVRDLPINKEVYDSIKSINVGRIK